MEKIKLKYILTPRKDDFDEIVTLIKVNLALLLKKIKTQ